MILSVTGRWPEGGGVSLMKVYEFGTGHAELVMMFPERFYEEVTRFMEEWTVDPNFVLTGERKAYAIWREGINDRKDYDAPAGKGDRS